MKLTMLFCAFHIHPNVNLCNVNLQMSIIFAKCFPFYYFSKLISKWNIHLQTVTYKAECAYLLVCCHLIAKFILFTQIFINLHNYK